MKNATKTIPILTAIISEAPIICDAEPQKRIPKVYAVATDAVDIDKYIQSQLNTEKTKFKEECYKYLLVFKRLFDEQNNLITQLGGEPLSDTVLFVNRVIAV